MASRIITITEVHRRLKEFPFYPQAIALVLVLIYHIPFENMEARRTFPLFNWSLYDTIPHDSRQDFDLLLTFSNGEPSCLYVHCRDRLTGSEVYRTWYNLQQVASAPEGSEDFEFWTNRLIENIQAHQNHIQSIDLVQIETKLNNYVFNLRPTLKDLEHVSKVKSLFP